MKMDWVLIFISLLSFTTSFGQTADKKFADAEDLLANDRFVATLPHYLIQ